MSENFDVSSFLSFTVDNASLTSGPELKYELLAPEKDYETFDATLTRRAMHSRSLNCSFLHWDAWRVHKSKKFYKKTSEGPIPIPPFSMLADQILQSATSPPSPSGTKKLGNLIKAAPK